MQCMKSTGPVLGIFAKTLRLTTHFKLLVKDWPGHAVAILELLTEESLFEAAGGRAFHSKVQPRVF